MNSTWLWPARYQNPAESAWLAAHKFAYINVLKGADLNRALAYLPASDRYGRKEAGLFHHIANERRQRRREGPKTDVLRGASSSEVFWSHRDAVSGLDLRYCPECLNAWYHSTVFQLLALSRCPVHGGELLSGCPRCGKFVTIEFNENDYTHPLHCHHCGEPFGGSPPRFAEIFRSQEMLGSTLAPLQAQISFACERSRFVGSSQSWRSMPGNAAIHFAALWKAAGFVANRFIDGQGADLIPMRVEEVADGPSAELLNERSREVRAVGRYLRRQVRAICGHRRPLDLDFYAIRSIDGWIEMVPPEGACACCFVLAKWKVQFAPLMAAARGKDVRSASAAQRLHIECLTAAYAVASFGFTALVVAQCLGLSHRPGATSSNAWPSGQISMLDAQMHVAGGDDQLVGFVGTPESASVIALDSGRVRDLLHHLAGVSMLRFRSQPAFYAGSTKSGPWGEAATEYQLSSMGRWLAILQDRRAHTVAVRSHGRPQGAVAPDRLSHGLLPR